METIAMDAKKELCCIQLVNDLPVLRARLGVSQEEIASKIGVSRQTYNAYEAKKRPIPWSVCIALITFFASNSKTREMMRNNTYTLELVDEIFQ
jgi:DNA-binding XRE family transcriptional regulator